MFALTVGVQAVRVLAIWAAGQAVGVTLSPRPYYVMGPLLFLVLLVPFTVNGLAVRESFFVSFLGGLGVDPSLAFATGFLFFVVTVTLSVPGAIILGWEHLGRPLEGARRGTPTHHPTAIVVGKIARVGAESEAIRTPCERRLGRRVGRRRHVQRAAVDRALPREHRGPRDRRRRPRLDRRNASTLVRARFPEVRVVEQENLGLGAGWNRGIRETSGTYVLILNADAWALDGARRAPRRVRRRRTRAPRSSGRVCATRRAAAAVRSRVSDTVAVATEYLFLRKLAPRSRALNAFYAAGFDHESVREADFVMGAVLLVRRAAIDEVGPLDEDFFLFTEETDWCYRFRRAGWQVLFTPDAEFVHVAGAAHAGRMFRENVRGHPALRREARGRARCGANPLDRARWLSPACSARPAVPADRALARERQRS